MSLPEVTGLPVVPDAPVNPPARRSSLVRLLFRDPMAVAAIVWLLIVLAAIVIGVLYMGEAATKVNLRGRNLAPFSLDQGWLFILGGDSLGRSVLARLMVAAGTTVGIAVTTAGLSVIVGTALGVTAGYFGGLVGTLILRIADMILSFPALLLALIVLYIFGPSPLNLIAVIGIARLPVYIRVARAEVLEIRERMFVDAARALGAHPLWIVTTHIVPILAPTMLTLGAVNLAMVMLLESGLSFLGLGIQPPAMSWGLLVSQGRSYLAQAWWLACFPGLCIMFTTLASNTLANWYRTASDPQQRWRLEQGGKVAAK